MTRGQKLDNGPDEEEEEGDNHRGRVGIPGRNNKTDRWTDRQTGRQDREGLRTEHTEPKTINE